MRQQRDPVEHVRKLLLDNKLAEAGELKAIEKVSGRGTAWLCYNVGKPLLDKVGPGGGAQGHREGGWLRLYMYCLAMWAPKLAEAGELKAIEKVLCTGQPGLLCCEQQQVSP